MKSVRKILTLTLFSLILFQAGSFWLLSKFNYQKIAIEAATSYNREISTRVNQQFRTFIESPITLNRVESNALRFGLLNFQNTDEANQYFWQNLQAYPTVNATLFGTIDGDMVGARHSPFDISQYEVVQVKQARNGDLIYYATDEIGLPKQVVEQTANYDPRKRPWYTKAIETGEMTWTPIYIEYATQSLIITAANPVYDKNGNLLGVIGSKLKFTEIHKYLSDLDVGQSSVVYLIEKDGTLISSSSNDPFYTENGNEINRVNAVDTENSLISASISLLFSQYNAHNTLNGEQILDSEINGEKYYTYIIPISDPYGINWFLITVVPETYFLPESHQYTHKIAGITFVVLLFTLLVSWLISSHFTRPIIQLSNAARDFSNGNWRTPITINRKDEIGLLANSFIMMRDNFKKLIESLKNNLNELQKTHTYLEQLISTANVMIIGRRTCRFCRRCGRPARSPAAARRSGCCRRTSAARHRGNLAAGPARPAATRGARR